MTKKILFLGILLGLFLGCDEEVEKIIKNPEKANLSFEKLEINGKSISTKQIFAQIKEKEKAGFQMKSLVVDNSEIAEVQGEKPNFSILIKKTGTFKITLILEKAGFEDVKIVGEITIIKKIATFEKLKITNGAKIISKNQILAQIKGLTNLDYQMKSIEIPAEKSDFAEVKNDFSIEIKKVGNFNAKIILEKSGKLNVEIENCAFEISNPIFTFEKLTKNDGNKIITKNEILGQIRGLTNLDYQIKNIEIPSEKSDFAEVKNDFSIEIKKVGIFTAKIILEKDGFLDIEIQNCTFEIINKTLFDFTYGGDNYDSGSAILEMADGNLIVAGVSVKNKNGDAWIFKIHKISGNILWEIKVGGNKYDSVEAMVEMDNGNVAVLAETYSKGEGRGDFWIFEMDKNNGNIVWERTYGGNKDDAPKSIIKTTDGNLVVTGIRDNGYFSNDLWVLKIDKTNGNTLWDKFHHSVHAFSSDGGYAILEMADGHLAVTGYTYKHVLADCWVLKIHKDNGNTIWQKTYGGISYDFGTAILQTSDGHLIIGAKKGRKKGARHPYRFWVLKIHKDMGNVIWEKTYLKNDNDDHDLKSIVATADGNFIIAGTTNKLENKDFWILKIHKNNGNILWEKTYGGRGDDYLNAMIKTKDGHLAIVGNTKSKGAGNADFWVLKLYENDGAIVGSR